MHVISALKRPRHDVRVATKLCLAVGVAGCLPPWHQADRVSMRAHLADSVVTADGTLEIRRVIYNRGQQRIFYGYGYGPDASFSIRDSLGRAACMYRGLHLGGEIGEWIAPGDSATHHTSFAISRLEVCGPGRYSVDVSTYFRLEGRTDRPLRAPRLALRIVPSRAR